MNYKSCHIHYHQPNTPTNIPQYAKQAQFSPFIIRAIVNQFSLGVMYFRKFRDKVDL